jgi:L-seryl-tRNA(Ser) seleniumtransferase
VTVEDCESQIGSGALPLETLPSAALVLRGGGPDALAARLRALHLPVIGRIREDALRLDLRCLEAPGPLLDALA